MPFFYIFIFFLANIAAKSRLKKMKNNKVSPSGNPIPSAASSAVSRAVSNDPTSAFYDQQNNGNQLPVNNEGSVDDSNYLSRAEPVFNIGLSPSRKFHSMSEKVAEIISSKINILSSYDPIENEMNILSLGGEFQDSKNNNNSIGESKCDLSDEEQIVTCLNADPNETV